MKKRAVIATFFVLLSLGTVAYAIHETAPAETQVVLPGPNAAALYDYITRIKPYSKWELWPGKGKMYNGTQPHGEFLTTYINENGYFDLKKKKGTLSEGAMIVKENYGTDKQFTALSVMYKIAGFNASAGDWFWVKYDKQGKVLASGRAEACIKCHEKRRDNDYIFTGELK